MLSWYLLLIFAVKCWKYHHSISILRNRSLIKVRQQISIWLVTLTSGHHDVTSEGNFEQMTVTFLLLGYKFKMEEECTGLSKGCLHAYPHFSRLGNSMGHQILIRDVAYWLVTSLINIAADWPTNYHKPASKFPQIFWTPSFLE